MNELKIDNEFKGLIPPLTQEEYKQLEDNVVKDGCLHELMTWNGIIVDGHNRYEICQKHDIPFKIKNWQFDTRDDVKEWIILNQFGRRNLSSYQRSELALKLKPLIQKKAKGNLKTSTGGNNPRPLQNSVNPVNSQKELAKIAGVSHDTIYRVDQIQQRATDEVKEKVKSGEMSIRQGYMSTKPKEEKPIETKVCSMCRAEKPLTEYYKPSSKLCGLCEGRLKRIKDPAERAAARNADYSDIIQMAQEMKKPSEEGKNENIYPLIVTEFIGLVNAFSISINKYLYMNQAFAGKSTIQPIIDKAITSLENIKKLTEV